MDSSSIAITSVQSIVVGCYFVFVCWGGYFGDGAGEDVCVFVLRALFDNNPNIFNNKKKRP